MRAPRTRRTVIGGLAAGSLLAATFAATSIAGLTGPTTAGADGTSPTSSGSGSGSASGIATATAAVTRKDLVDRVSVDGTLGYGDARPVGAGRPGTIVSLPGVGTVIERGQSLMTVDDRPLPLFYGTVPLWRNLSAAVTDGPDIRQLEENLAALGFTDGLLFTVDEHFDSATTVAVQRWQKSVGATETAIVEKGDLVFQPGAVRVKEHKAEPGDAAQPGGPALTVTGTDRAVTLRLDVARQTMAREGDAVQVELPGATTVAGKISRVGTVATKDASDSSNPGAESGPAKIDITVTLDDPAGGGRLDEAPVKVKLTRSTAKQVLTVPVGALLALREGGYAVEVDRGGRRSLVGVKVAASADAWVEVTGDVREGDLVVVAT